jgi:15-cis-phytoene synthase
MMSLAPGHADLQAVMNHHAKSFSWAARFLSLSARQDAALLYAFARTADDLADEEHLGTWAERSQRLHILRDQAMHLTGNSGLACDTGVMLQRHGVPTEVLGIFMDSLLADAGACQFETQQELLRFAYGVAGTVGQMMSPIIGASPAAAPYAVALGIGMQLTNIARDVVEDAQRQRCYIPSQWGVDAQTLAAPKNAQERQRAFAAIQRLLAWSDEYYAFATTGFKAIPTTNRRAIVVASTLYQAIGHKILHRGADAYWQGRVSLGAVEKSWLLARCALGSVYKLTTSPRDVWQQDLGHLTSVPGFPAKI